MTTTTNAYNGSHNACIRQFEMKDKPEYRFCAEEDILRILVRYALVKAFNDFNFRTLDTAKTYKATYEAWAQQRKDLRRQQPWGHKTIEEPSVTRYLMERLGNAFEDRFLDYFTHDPLTEEDFDDWHHTTCQMFLDNLNSEGDAYRHLPELYTNLAYGKAQKIVNMMFKHLYCFDSKEPWDDKWELYFRPCHVTLDNFTLVWFERKVVPQRIESWSNLVYAGDSVDTNNYRFYLQHIRNFFAREKKDPASLYANVTPFQAEFYIWPEIQLRLAAEGFLFELKPEAYKGMGRKPQEEKMKLLKLPIEDLIQRVQDTIKEYRPR